MSKNKNKFYIKVEEPVNLAFALRYLNMFTKASALSERVLSNFFSYLFFL